VSAIDKFAGIAADFWDCDEQAELLTHEYPQCAIEAQLDGWVDTSGKDAAVVEAQIRERGTIRVWPSTRATIDDERIQALTDHLLDAADEWLDDQEDLGDPNDSCWRILGDAVKQANRPAMLEVVRKLCAGASVWHCERGEPIELSPHDVIELMREHCPEWFEPEPEAA
jgi:hypothetical protein